MQVQIRLHGALQRHSRSPDRLLTVEVPDGATLHDLFDALADDRPALERAIRDETGSIRPHVNVFVDGEHVRDRRSAPDLGPDASVLVLPAVSGGCR